MEYICVGKIVNTHGIKGEVRIISDFEYKEVIFKNGKRVFVGKNKTELIINTYRVHKNYDMIIFDGFSDINNVLNFKGEYVYIDRKDYVFDKPINEDIIGMKVYNNEIYIGDVSEILKSPAHKILVISNNDKKNMIPFIDEFIDKIDLDNKMIKIKIIKGLLDED